MSQENQKNQLEIEESLRECWAVSEMVKSQGWAILSEYLRKTIEANNRVWLLLPEGDPKLKDLKHHAAVCYSIISLVENFDVQRKKLEELWIKLESDKDEIPFDVDTETPLKEGV